MTSIPSVNLTPWISFGNWLWPSMRRQFFCAPSTSLKTMASAVLFDKQPFEKSFGCMPAVRTPEASRTLTVSCPGILPSPLRDKVGAFHHDRFRGYVSVHFRSGLRPPCLRFAVAVAGHHARLGTRLLVRLCRGRHHRRLNSMRLQGATPTPPGIRVRTTAVRRIKHSPAFP